jgi:molybdenum cofactor synthesis domain-containing protein
VIKKISVLDAVGTKLAHDITEIRPGEFKGPAFQKGHTVCDEDICHLQKLGKNNLYLIDLDEEEIHENQAASILARGLAGEGITWKDEPREGKIGLHAAQDGILVVDKAALAAFNLIDEVMCATRSSYSLVKKGELVAATRAIPLVMKRAPIERAAAIASQNKGVVSVHSLNTACVGIIITGNEVFHGLIQDRFAPVLTRKIEDLGSQVHEVTFVPDDTIQIQQAVERNLAEGCNLILVSGGMSVDPDDVTRKAIYQSGADEIHYGAAVLPGSMFMVAYRNNIPIIGIPACGLHHRITVLDLVLPRILSGERVGKKELAFLGHGGLCLDCKPCVYPHCPFGKG